jgi:FKBP-type peptidyl-prolyl cis-trans isomerase FklB
LQQIQRPEFLGLTRPTIHTFTFSPSTASALFGFQAKMAAGFAIVKSSGGKMKLRWILLVGFALTAWNANAQTAATPQTPAAKTGAAATPAPKKAVTTTPAAKAPTKAPAKAPGAAATLTTDKQKLSYAVGIAFARSLKAQGIEVDSTVVDKGLADGFSGGPALMTDDQLKATMQSLQADVQKKEAAAMAEASAKFKVAGDAFRADNGKKPGVVTLPSGLQYKIVTPGDGKKPGADSTILCNYRGTFIDGMEFDSSHDKPVPFTLKGIIPGMSEALQLMSTGAKWQLVIPPNLAYGDRGAGGVIGPNTTLVFDVEVVSIQDK